MFLLVRARWRRYLASRRARRRARRAVEGEHEAEALLRDAGYDVCDRQVALTWTIMCDGEAVDIELRADLIVERDGARYVAEVKTGEHAPRISNAATRRQLLEYLVAYKADGVLLVDVPEERVQQVEFGV